MQRRCPTLKQRRNNVTQRRKNSAQRWYNFDTTLFQPGVDVRAGDDYGFANRLIVFILLNEKTFITIW